MNYLNILIKGINENGEEKEYKLKDFIGNNLIIYFYPSDDTPVCTQEAQSFRDSIQELNKYAKIIGVSNNDIQDHIDFHNKHNLNFIMLSDIKEELKNNFKKYLKTFSTIHRATFILNRDGEIIKAWEKVDVNDQIDEIISFFKTKNKTF